MMFRHAPLALAASLIFSVAHAQDTTLDPLVLKMDASAFETGGACYLADFNKAFGGNIQMERLFHSLVDLPRDDAMRGRLQYDRLLMAVEMALGQTCDVAVPPPDPTPPIDPQPDSRLVDIWRSGQDACVLRETYSVLQATQLIAVMDTISDASLALKGMERGALLQRLNRIIATDCETDAPAPDQTPTPLPLPLDPITPKPSPAPEPTPLSDWRDLPFGEEMSHVGIFEIPLKDLLIADRYIVTFREPMPVDIAATLNLPATAVLEVMPSLDAAVLGVGEGRLADILANPQVEGLTQDRLGFFNEARPANNAAQDLVDQITPNLDDTFNPLNENRKIRVYVVDGGMWPTQNEIKAKRLHWRAIGDFHGGLNAHICARHATAVASLIAGEELGIAQNVDLVDVDITPCDGRVPTSFPASHILIALDWIGRVQDKRPRDEPILINMSLGVPSGDEAAFVKDGIGPGIYGLDAFEAKVRQFLNRRPNITIVTAAGNSAANACHFFPARMPEVITVGGSTLSNTLWGKSNFGPCVDTFALAQDVAVADPALGNDGQSRINGTSFSTAIVTGVIAHRLAAGQNISDIRADILRPVTMERTLQANLARQSAPENGALTGQLNFLARIPSAFRPDCEVNSYDGTLNLRSGPKLQNQILRVMQNGDRFKILSRADDKWAFVALEDGSRGWVASYDKRASLVRDIANTAGCAPD